MCRECDNNSGHRRNHLRTSQFDFLIRSSIRNMFKEFADIYYSPEEKDYYYKHIVCDRVFQELKVPDWYKKLMGYSDSDLVLNSTIQECDAIIYLPQVFSHVDNLKPGFISMRVCGSGLWRFFTVNSPFRKIVGLEISIYGTVSEFIKPWTVHSNGTSYTFEIPPMNMSRLDFVVFKFKVLEDIPKTISIPKDVPQELVLMIANYTFNYNYGIEIVAWVPNIYHNSQSTGFIRESLMMAS